MRAPTERTDAARAARVLWRLGSCAVAWILAQGIFESLAAPLWGALSRAVGEPVPLYPFSMLVGVAAGSWTGLRFIEEGPWTLVGFSPGVWQPRRLALGLLIGVLAIGATSALLAAIGAMRLEKVAAPLGGVLADSWGDTALRLVVILAPAALWEELAFRGYLYGVGLEAGSRQLARWSSCVAFGVVHLLNPGAGVRTTALVMLAGWCLALVREELGLPAAWLAHFTWNWIMAAVLHVAVSGLPFATPGYRAVLRGPDWLTGGSWGPEGGLVAALVLAGAAGWSHRTRRTADAEPDASQTSGFVRSRRI